MLKARMWKQTCLVLFFVVGLAWCLHAPKGVQHIERRDVTQVDGGGTYYGRAAQQWCYCCNYSNTNVGCNQVRLGCYSQFPFCITTIEAPSCEKVVITKSCASMAYCQQQELLNPPECADGLVPVGKTCDYCCAGRGCNEYPQLTQTYSSSPHCPDKNKMVQKNAKGQPTKTDSSFCGKNRYDNVRPTSETTSPKGYYPWTVKIHEKLNFNGVCAGAIIDERWIVTSASCVKEKDGSRYTMVAGEHSLFMPDTTEQSLEAEKIFVHPGYNSDGTGNNDIALIKTKYPIQFDESVQPICLPKDSDDFSDTTCTQSGWAVNGFQQSRNTMSQVDMLVVGHKPCWRKYGVSGTQTVCGVTSAPSQPLCGWDSGSPLQCKKDGLYVLAGVTSQGPEFPACVHDQHDKGKPNVFTDVAAMMNWIIGTQIQDALNIPI